MDIRLVDYPVTGLGMALGGASVYAWEVGNDVALVTSLVGVAIAGLAKFWFGHSKALGQRRSADD